MRTRAKSGLLCFLFLLVLGIAVFMFANALQAVHDFQQQRSAVKAGDVSAIRPWMTIHVISHIYHVPEVELDQSLHIARAGPLQRMTLYEIAASKHQPVEQIIHRLQQTILTYHKAHPPSSSPRQRLKFRVSLIMPASEGTAA